jgi:phosphatidylserine/phosphatidylglycerophosphate/cardiolipin synthase-like enzyme
MTKNIWWLRKKLKKYKKLFIFSLLIFILGSVFLIIISKKMTDLNLFNFSLPKYLTSQQIDSENNFSGKIYFNDHFKTHLFSDIIISAIRSAKKTINLAMYSFNLKNLKDELYQAEKRGVKITMVFDQNKKEQHNIVFNDLPSNIDRIDVDSEAGYMHHKFLIIDQGTNNQSLILESLNWTDWQEQFDPSFLFITSEEEIIQAYGQEFERIKNGFCGIKKITKNNYQPWARRINYKDSFFDIWWGPGIKTNSLNEKIVDLLNEAKNDIKIMIWQATDYKIANTILKKAREGLKIKIITDDFNIQKNDSVFSFLLYKKWEEKLNNLEILDDSWRTLDFKNEIPNSIVGEVFNSFIHHHALIIDNQIVLFGTNNWSNSANHANDESMLITNHQEIVSSFLQSFDFHYNQLRKQPLLISKNGEKLLLTYQKEYQNKKLMIITSQDILIDERASVCFDKNIESSDKDEAENIVVFILPEPCQNIFLNAFVYDENYNIIANNLIAP